LAVQVGEETVCASENGRRDSACAKGCADGDHVGGRRYGGVLAECQRPSDPEPARAESLDEQVERVGRANERECELELTGDRLGLHGDALDLHFSPSVSSSSSHRT